MRVPGFLFLGLIPITTWFTRRPGLNWASRPLMRFLGWLSMFIAGSTHKNSVKEIADEWQRVFPLEEAPKVVNVENEIAYAEIHILCKHRGTGNVEGCYRMMEYDRKILETVGGELVVLRSQAEPGVTVCQVAIRKQGGAPVAELLPAHERVRAAQRRQAATN